MSSEWIKACNVKDVSEEEPCCVEMSDGKMVAVYKVGEEYFSTDDLCTHGNASLSEGWQEGDKIECPFHGGSFHIKTGEPANYPCVKPLRTYPVKVDGDDIIIEYPKG